MENSDSKFPTSLPPQQEPDLKRPKMSTTTSDDEDAAASISGDTTTTTKKQRYKRRKIAIFFAYCGVGYQGMQKNPGAKTIEGDLEEALFHSGAVPEQDRGCPKRYDWARSARTDKGVSAVGQVISGRFYVDPPGLVERLNSNLSSQIRIFGYKRVTASFNAKKFCDRRRYVYLIPVFALDPCSHPDRESVLASMGSGNELVKCLECSERGRKVIGAVGKHSFESKSVVSETAISSKVEDALVKSEIKDDGAKSVVSQTDILSNSGGAVVKSEIEGDISVQMDNGYGGNANSDPIIESGVFQNEGSETESVIPQSSASLNNENANINPQIQEGIIVSLENGGGGGGDDNNGNAKSEDMNKELKNIVEEEKVNGEQKVTKGNEFCYGEKEKERINRILKYYVGSHNFHNFTTRTKAEDPSAWRYIVSFDANTMVTVEGIEFVKCEVVGQSFMLHQIRKMIGLAVAIMRNCARESLLQTALQKNVNINVPTAPEVGLYLDECLFTSYNTKWKDSHEELSMEAYEEEAEDFKMKNIYTHIASTEHKEGAVALWLHSLNHRNYPDLRDGNSGDYNAKESAEVKNMAE